MKNVIKSILSCILMFAVVLAMLPIQHASEINDEMQIRKMCVSVNDVMNLEMQVIKYKDDIYMSADSFGLITKYEFIPGEYDNIGYRLGEKLIIINKYTGYMQISCMNYTGSIGETLEYENEYYFSASMLLPWLNVGCYVNDGVLYVIWDALSFWEALEGLTYEDYMFNLYLEYGDSVSSIVTQSAMMVFDTLINLRVDRLISADGLFGAVNGESVYDYKCYVSALSEMALNDFLESSAAQEVIKTSIKINKNIDKIETVLGVDEKKLQKDIDDYLWELGTDAETVEMFYDLSESWIYLRESISSYEKISKYLDVFNVFKAYELTVNASTEYVQYINWLKEQDVGSNVFSKALNEATIKLNDEYGVLFTFYMDLAKNVFAKVPSFAIKAIANNTANEALLSTLSSVSVATDFIGSLGAYMAIAKIVFNTLFPVAKGYEEMSKINITEGIQDYCWELADSLKDQDFTLDNLMHIRQSYITALKTSRMCFNAQQETFNPFNDDNILSYKFNMIDSKIAQLFCSADASLNDSAEGKQEYCERLLLLFEHVDLYENSTDHIKVSYKKLVSALYEKEDNLCEYSIYDMDQDGTTELIYMKGTCMADLKIHYYTYYNGKVEKLGETYGSYIFKTENGEGLYWYYCHMGYEVKYLVSKINNDLEEKNVYERNVENYSFPDDKYLLESFHYNDHSGIDRYAYIKTVNNVG